MPLTRVLMPRSPRQPRQLPNVDDPLAEATPQRRLWGAYLRAGFTRADFARAVGVAYHTLDAWDTEAAMPDMLRFARAAELVGYTTDELIFGHGGMHAQRGVAEPVLTVESIRALLGQMSATPEQAQALAEHRASTRGEFSRFTQSFVRTFINHYALMRSSGFDHGEAKLRAMDAAENAQAAVDAHLRGVKPITDGGAAFAERVQRRLNPARASSSTPVRKKKRAAKPKRRSVD